ncbi:unnamed protein product [Spirodela intermedia]|uniref:Uncharacterized protein n=1 Tax=Spirodela intermedia TaxID=51605 RepID=A0ABN7ECT4_SPIIN|nr:unnamed protein product [Spirodela intermedia]
MKKKRMQKKNLKYDIPMYAKILKELYKSKREPRTEKLFTHVSAMLLNQMPQKLKDPGAPLISCNIGGYIFRNVLLGLGASINLLPRMPFGLCNAQLLFKIA